MTTTEPSTQQVTPASVAQAHVHARKESLARFTLGYWLDRPKCESLLQITNPIGQHIAFYVHDDEKKRVIAELRKALDAWEKTP